MATWADVRAVVRSLPETVEREPRSWRVKDKLLVWERPLRKSDLEALGDRAPTGPILGAMVPDLDTKEARLAAEPKVYFTTPHFNGYPAVLVRLGAIRVPGLRELVLEAWLDRAPKKIVKTYLEDKASKKKR